MQLSNCHACAQHPRFAEAGGLEGTRSGRNRPVREAAASLRVETKTDLKVQTAEGDQVTISIEALAQLEAASRQGRNGNVSYSRSYSSSEINIEVQGSLSEAELEDLTELISALSGGGGSGEGQTLDLESLAGFDFRQTQTIEGGSLFSLAA